MTAVGPLKVLTNPIFTLFGCAAAGPIVAAAAANSATLTQPDSRDPCRHFLALFISSSLSPS
jgi:hypothetical protein